MKLIAKSNRRSARLTRAWSDVQTEPRRNGLGAITACLSHMQQCVEQLQDGRLPPARQAVLSAGLADQSRVLGSQLARVLAQAATPQLVSTDALLLALVEDCRRHFPRFRFNLSLAAERIEPVENWPQLKLAFALMMENAMRRGPLGSEILVSGAADAAGQGLVISFHDQGPGIAPDQLALVFDDPRRVGSARLFGMGITLARCLVEAVGGCLWVDSGPGGGATFSIGLPRKLPLRRWIVPRPRVLVIDEDPQLRAGLAAQMRDAGYAVQTAACPADGLARLRAFCPDLVLLEFAPAPKEAASTLAQLRRVTDAPVVFISDYRDKGIVADALWAGATDYVSKPFDTRELLARAAAILRRRQPLPTPETGALLGPLLGAVTAPQPKPYLQ